MNTMTYPISINDDGVKIKPELMEKEKLYHCLFQNKIMLIFKDDQDILSCYEIEEDELVEKIKACSNKDDIEKILEQYIQEKNLKH